MPFGSGLTFDISHPIFRLFLRSAHGGITHTKIYTHLGECIVPTPIRLGQALVAGLISLSKIAQWFYGSLFLLFGYVFKRLLGVKLALHVIYKIVITRNNLIFQLLPG